MSIWSRLAAAIGSIARNEPLHRLFDRFQRPPERSVAFTIAVIALGAKMAKADGRVTVDEVSAFREIFLIPAGEERNAARIYNLARRDVAGFESYAERIAVMFAGREEVLPDVLEGLVYIAAADGEYHPEEHAFLDRVRTIFGIDDATFRSIRARHVEGESDPWQVMGLAPGASAEELRRAYRRLVRELHPDRLGARGLPLETRRFAERRLAAVNVAYAELTRGARPSGASP